MNILVITTLYPNETQFRHGIFIETRLRELQRFYPEYRLTVVAPVPHYPLVRWWRGRYHNICVPIHTVRHDIDVYHPKYLAVPFIGMHLNPFTLLRGLKRFFRHGPLSLTDFDLIDCHYFYPDGYAVSKLAHAAKLPLVITARGSDIEVLPQHLLPRMLIRQAIRNSSFCGAVSQKLKAGLLRLGCPAKKAVVLPNGIDQQQFAPVPMPQQELKEKFGTGSAYTLLMVGNLVQLKGHALVLAALQELPDVHILIVGSGPELPALQQQVKTSGLTSQVQFFGNLPQAELCQFYSCADALVLMSSSEGWPNVILEAMSCGAAVISTRVGSADEIIQSDLVGELLPERSSAALTDAIQRCRQRRFDRAQIRNHAKGFSWQHTAERLNLLYQQAAAGGQVGG
jgi:glycosyltransferase involved in cell wall biosynthesis